MAAEDAERGKIRAAVWLEATGYLMRQRVLASQRDDFYDVTNADLS